MEALPSVWVSSSGEDEQAVNKTSISKAETVAQPTDLTPMERTQRTVSKAPSCFTSVP